MNFHPVYTQTRKQINSALRKGDGILILLQLKSITLQGVIPSISNTFRFGLWSKFNPLTSNLLVGSAGLFDNHRNHLHSAVEESSLNFNLIYYDCIDYSFEKTSKTIDVKPQEYENIWQDCQILQSSLQERFELIFIHQQKSMRENLKIKQPSKYQSLKLIFVVA
ncbi:unnamed protein product [Paramecium pentaurelia]|uniref:Uncharacterized protein n=1 Tax=Paramecium pentaurelia TaxID=43138 RepID=A0A8S1WQ61_9CILI|nr:unnamed protein product [Paramecium pentaurelia]